MKSSKYIYLLKVCSIKEIIFEKKKILSTSFVEQKDINIAFLGNKDVLIISYITILLK